MTFSHSSKESLRPLTQRDKVDEEFSHSTKESLRPLTQGDKVDEEELYVEYLDISFIKISNNHGGNTFCKDNDLFPFSFFYPDKRAFNTIKRSADNSDRCAFLQVDFVRCKIN